MADWRERERGQIWQIGANVRGDRYGRLERT